MNEVEETTKQNFAKLFKDLQEWTFKVLNEGKAVVIKYDKDNPSSRSISVKTKEEKWKHQSLPTK